MKKKKLDLNRKGRKEYFLESREVVLGMVTREGNISVVKHLYSRVFKQIINNG
jgi:hypothetical protein